MKNKYKSNLSILLIPLVTIACSLFAISQTSSTIPDGLMEDYSPASDANLNGTFSYSEDQHVIKNNLGNPTRFTILFSENTRQETWFYDTSGYSVAFRNGAKISEKMDTPIYREEMYATTFNPDQFYEGMGIDEIVLSTGQDDFMVTSVEGLDGGRLIHMEGLSIGLINGKVSFIETYPAMTEIKLEPDDFTQSIPLAQEGPNIEEPPTGSSSDVNLTPEEAENVGKHKYLVVVNIEGDVINEVESTFEITFFDGKVRLTENGKSIDYEQVGANQYFAEDETLMRLTFISGGFIQIFEGDEYDVEVLYSLLD